MKRHCAQERDEGLCVNCCLRTYQWSCRSFYLKRKKKKKKWTKVAVLTISISISDGPAMLGYFLDKRPLQKRSKPSKKP